ncbi:antitoxin [Arthrobacter sp. JZ12]|nr:antitoxin [Arthrobacter sp. JZ12]
MSVFDGLKGKAGELKSRAAGLVDGNSGMIKEGIGHAGSFINSRTGGKYSDKISTVQSRAFSMIDNVDSKDGNRLAGSANPAA